MPDMRGGASGHPFYVVLAITPGPPRPASRKRSPRGPHLVSVGEAGETNTGHLRHNPGRSWSRTWRATSIDPRDQPRGHDGLSKVPTRSRSDRKIPTTYAIRLPNTCVISHGTFSRMTVQDLFLEGHGVLALLTPQECRDQAAEQQAAQAGREHGRAEVEATGQRRQDQAPRPREHGHLEPALSGVQISGLQVR